MNMHTNTTCFILMITVGTMQAAGLQNVTVKDTVMDEYRAGYAEGQKYVRGNVLWVGAGGVGAMLGGSAGTFLCCFLSGFNRPVSWPIGSAVGSASGGCVAGWFVGYHVPGNPKLVPDSSASYRLGFTDGYKNRARWRNFRNAMVGTIIGGVLTAYLMGVVVVGRDL